ncbi:MAG TPA: AI-2E family transporter [Longimicrobium sp.]|nr:AI-2E family transporter [Longimicrobium sp.]
MAEQKSPQAAPRVPADAVAVRPAAGIERVRPSHIYRAVALAFMLALAYRFFDQLSRTFLLAYAATILAVVLNGLRAWIPVRRTWLAAGVGVLVVGGLVLLLSIGLPAVFKQARSIASTGPQLNEQIARWEQSIQQQTGMQVDIPSPESLMRRSPRESGGAADTVGRAVGLLEVLFIPIVVFFGALFALASPNDKLLNPVMRALPDDVRPAWYRIFQLLAERLIGWIKGTATAMAGVALLSIAAFWAIGVPNALALGLLNGLVEFIPLFGPWIGGLAATLVAFLDDPSKAMWVALAALAIQQIEANVITPWAMRRNAEVHPFVTLFALVLFGGLFGFLGILLAIPLVLLVWTTVQVLWVERAIDTDRERIAPVAAE